MGKQGAEAVEREAAVRPAEAEPRAVEWALRRAPEQQQGPARPAWVHRNKAESAARRAKGRWVQELMFKRLA